jgi:hypothetical protein
MDSQDRRIRTAAGIAALAFLPAACGTASGTGRFHPAGAAPLDGPPVTAEAATARSPDARSVLSQYRRFHVVFLDALATNDPRHIPEVATGYAAQELTETVRRQARQGIIRRGHDAVNPRIALLRPGTAVVVDCVVTGGLWAYRVRTGTRTGPTPGPTPTPRRLRALLTLDGGVWKVAQTRVPADSRC